MIHNVVIVFSDDGDSPGFVYDDFTVDEEKEFANVVQPSVPGTFDWFCSFEYRVGDSG